MDTKTIISVVLASFILGGLIYLHVKNTKRK